MLLYVYERDRQSEGVHNRMTRENERDRNRNTNKDNDRHSERINELFSVDGLITYTLESRHTDMNSTV